MENSVNSVGAGPTEGIVKKQLARNGSRPSGLNLLERRLVDSHSTVIIPLDDRIIFVRSFNCAKFSGRLSEVTQTLDAISGIQFLVSG